MGIGVSYTGANGSTSSFTAGSVTDLLRQLQSQSSAGGMTNSTYHQLKEARKAARAEKNLGRGASPSGGIDPRSSNVVKNLVGFNSSIEEHAGKLQLKGDDRISKTGSVFGKNGDGIKGFWSLDELLEFIDKRSVGENIGSSDSDDADPQTKARDAESNDPFTISVVTRLAVDRNENPDDPGDVQQYLYAFVRDISFTGRGRAFAVSEERMLSVCPMNGGGGGGGLSSVKVTGTDGKTVEGSDFKIESADDSNVEVKATKDEATGLITLKIGVYYK